MLKALREYRVDVNEAILLELLSTVEEKTDRRAERIYGETLKMLAVSHSSEARDAINLALDHPSKRVRRDAADAQMIAAGLEEPLAAVWQKLESQGWQSLTAPQQHVLAVRMLIDEVNNGGFLQYFVNSTGDHWRDAESGLVDIGAVNDSRLFEQVLQRFGTGAPRPDGRQRHAQVARIANTKERPFQDIESAFYEDEDDREVLISRYVLKHREDFGENA